VCFFTIKVTVLTFIISTFTKKKTNKQVLNNLLRIEQNVKESKLKNPEWDLTLKCAGHVVNLKGEAKSQVPKEP